MYAALAATALLGVTAVLVQDEETLWQLTGTSLAVAVASGLTCCWTLLGISRIFRRAASLLCIATGVELLLIILLIWSDPLGIREELNLLLCAWAIMVLLPLGVIAMVLLAFSIVANFGAMTYAIEAAKEMRLNANATSSLVSDGAPADTQAPTGNVTWA